MHLTCSYLLGRRLGTSGYGRLPSAAPLVSGKTGLPGRAVPTIRLGCTMTRPCPGGGQVRPAVPVSYAAFVLLGIGAGASGVLLPSQMAGYAVNRATIGISFFTISAGW